MITHSTWMSGHEAIAGQKSGRVEIVVRLEGDPEEASIRRHGRPWTCSWPWTRGTWGEPYVGERATESVEHSVGQGHVEVREFNVVALGIFRAPGEWIRKQINKIMLPPCEQIETNGRKNLASDWKIKTLASGLESRSSLKFRIDCSFCSFFFYFRREVRSWLEFTALSFNWIEWEKKLFVTECNSECAKHLWWKNRPK